MTTTEAAASNRVLSFAVGGREFSVPAAEVLEVRRAPVITRVPNSSPSLAGLMNYYGSAIAVVRMSSLLGLTSVSDVSARESRVVVYAQSPPVGLLVDKVVALGDGGAALAAVDIPSELEKHFVAGSSGKVRVARSAEMARTAIAAAAAEISLLAFRVAGQRYALPLGAVAEVLVLPEQVAELPRGAGSALGMLDNRDGVLPLMSVASLLGLKEADGRRHVLIALLNGAQVGLVVGAVDGVVRVPETAIEAVPAILQRGQGDAEIDGIARLGRDRSLISVLSPARLFANREVEAALQHSNTGTSAMPELAADTVDLQFVVFGLGDETYGLPIAAVDEIVRLPETLTRVPGAPEFVAGVMNLRGKALPLIDQRRRFEAPGEAGRGRVIVVTVGQLQAGFIVDSVSQIMRVPANEVTRAPRMPGDGVEVFDRVAPTADGMLLVVDPKELLDKAERDLLANFKSSEGSAASL
jgi:purine-binding chemotaxis protein CheW